MATTSKSLKTVGTATLLMATLGLAGCAGGWQGGPGSVEEGPTIDEGTDEQDPKLPPVPPAPPQALMCPKEVVEPPQRKKVSVGGDTLFAGEHVLVVPPGTVPSDRLYSFVFAEPRAEYIVVQAARSDGPLDSSMWMTLSTARCADPAQRPTRVLHHKGRRGDQWTEMKLDSFTVKMNSLTGAYEVTFRITDFSNYALAAPQ